MSSAINLPHPRSVEEVVVAQSCFNQSWSGVLGDLVSSTAPGTYSMRRKKSNNNKQIIFIIKKKSEDDLNIEQKQEIMCVI
tara:strand:- start:277 stop:519 length:243 start_codon:yes stop_codon:yes gene_type:complete